MKFTKMEGCGNDYIFVDARYFEADWPVLAHTMSDRHYGIGGDGLILLKESESADLKMEMFNADGSEGELCGNGIRCFAKYAIDRDIVEPSSQKISVETPSGLRIISPIWSNGSVTKARVAMGLPRLKPQDVPVMVEPSLGRRIGEAVVDYPLTVDGIDLSLTFVSMGNPHAVAFIESSVSNFPLQTIGPLVEHHSLFPKRVNFEIAEITGDGEVNARVWERGSGETLACGTGACAITVATRLLGADKTVRDITAQSLDVTLPGGVLSVFWDGQGDVYLEGPAVEVFDGEWKD